MAGGGKAPKEQTVNQTTTNLPKYAEPYYTSMMGQAQALSNQPYQNYEGQRLAGFNQNQQQVQNETMGLQTPDQFQFGSNMAGAAGLGSLQAANYTPGQFNAQQVNAPGLQNFAMNAPDQFGQQQADQYMSPYQQSVVDIQKREATRDAKMGQLQSNLGAARQGTYGGSRQLMASLERERQLGQNLSDIQQKGSQAAYENAQQQFERDRAAQMNVGQQNLQSYLQTQGLGAQNYMQSALANQQYGLEAQRLGEQSRQFGASNALAGYGQAGQMAQTLGNLGQYQQQADLARLQAQGGVGQAQQGLTQQQLDMQYSDFLRQRDYPWEQLQQQSSLMHGVPVGLSSTSTAYAPNPSMMSQLVGTGLGALGTYNTLKGG